MLEERKHTREMLFYKYKKIDKMTKNDVFLENYMAKSVQISIQIKTLVRDAPLHNNQIAS